MRGVILGLFTLLLAGAAYFSLERILFCDASFILFRIINYQTLQIQEHRYGSFITQSVPYFAAQLHLPLNAIVLLYSVSFNLFYLCVAAVLLFRYRQTSLALLMALYYVLFVSDSYFWTNNEVHQGIAWMFLWVGTYLYMQEKKTSVVWLIPAFAILCFLAVFTHPLVLFPAVFLWMFFLLQQRQQTPKWLPVFLSVVLLAICYARYKTSSDPSSFYDAEKLKVFKDVQVRDLVNTFTSPMAKEIFHRSVSNYWLVPLLFFIGIFSAIRQRKYAEVILTIGFCFVYFIAICLTFYDFIPFYTESEWMPFTIIASAPFVFYSVPYLKPRTGIVIISLIFLVRLTYIFQSSKQFTHRKDTIISVLQSMDQHHLNKAIVNEDENNRKVFIMNWGVPTESFIASALRRDHPQKNFVIIPMNDTASKIPSDPHLLIVPFGTMHFSELNRRYFEMDTVEVYKVLRY